MAEQGSEVLELPTGTVTFMFTDIEGSTRLLQQVGEDAYRDLLAAHHRILREAISAGGGVEVQTDGDAFFAVFPTARGALRAATQGQRAIWAHAWPEGSSLRARMGLHAGDGVLAGDNYIGLDVHRAARISAAGHGGQVLISDATRALVENALPAGVVLRDLGLHRLKDIEQVEHLHQLAIEGLPDEFPPIRTLDARQTNLPPQRTSFIGREREVAEVSGLLERTRLLTLTGPGGIGKTRLALKVAADSLGRFAGGVYFADLSPITDAGLVPSAIAGALLVREEPGRAPIDTLADHLRDRQLLLVLDNLEHLPEAATVPGRLLDAAPQLTVLATSRVPLHLAGEQEFPVPPLALPEAVEHPDVDRLGRYEAVRLFVERAAAGRPGFRLSADNAAAISQITAKLDGLPLAIELAAGRAKLLTPDAILARLGTRLSLLTGGARDLPARQRTLRSAIEWSHDLLVPDERRLFARLAAFSGSWSLDAAEAVCAPGLTLSVLDGLGSLVDQSLVRRIGDVGGDARFAMLESIREYATERLAASGERDEMRRGHAAYILALAESSAAGTGERDAPSVERLEVERDNVRAALAWAIDAGEADIGLRTAAAIWTFWPRRDLAEGRTWLQRLLALPRAQRRDAVRARALTSLGAIELWQNDYEVSRACLEEAAAIARELPDPRLLAHAIDSLEVLARAAGDLERATILARQGLAAAEEAEDQVLSAEFRGRLGLIDIFNGRPYEAIEPLASAVAVQRRAGSSAQVALLLAALGTAKRMVGDLTAAKGHYREALQISLDLGNTVLVGTMIIGYASVASSERRHERAARLLGAAARIRRDAGGGPLPELMRRLGDPEGDARRAIGDEAFERARGDGEGMAMEQAVSYALADGDPPAHDPTQEGANV